MIGKSEFLRLCVTHLLRNLHQGFFGNMMFGAAGIACSNLDAADIDAICRAI